MSVDVTAEPHRENAYLTLLQRARENSTRPFKARGTSIARCQRCLLGEQACICRWRVESKLELDFILIMHHDEIFKPTNTGRLLADLFPHNTFVFEWSRTAPDAGLIEILNDQHRQCLLLFPHSNEQAESLDSASQLDPNRRLTLVVLDGTWKQAKKMFRSSDWLTSYSHLSIDNQGASDYSVRQAPTLGQLSTAEASAQALSFCGHTAASQLLKDYFLVFKDHYLAVRKNISPQFGAHHQRLENIKT